MARSTLVPACRRQTGAPSIGTRMAADWLKTMRGGSFLTGTARAFFSSPLMASEISSRSSDMVDGPLEAMVCSACR